MDPDRAHDLAQLAAALRADAERVIVDRLHLIETVSTIAAGIFVRRHARRLAPVVRSTATRPKPGGRLPQRGAPAVPLSTSGLLWLFR